MEHNSTVQQYLEQRNVNAEDALLARELYDSVIKKLVPTGIPTEHPVFRSKQR
jgi:hypothetical protein